MTLQMFDLSGKTALVTGGNGGIGMGGLRNGEGQPAMAGAIFVSNEFTLRDSTLNGNYAVAGNISGAIGGIAGGSILGALVGGGAVDPTAAAGAAAAAGGLDWAQVIAQLVGGVGGGGILTAIVGAVMKRS